MPGSFVNQARKRTRKGCGFSNIAFSSITYVLIAKSHTCSSYTMPSQARRIASLRAIPAYQFSHTGISLIDISSAIVHPVISMITSHMPIHPFSHLYKQRKRFQFSDKKLAMSIRRKKIAHKGEEKYAAPMKVEKKRSRNEEKNCP